MDLAVDHQHRPRLRGVVRADPGAQVVGRVEHPRALAEASGATLWLEPGFGHAEAAIGPALVDRIGAHVARVLA